MKKSDIKFRGRFHLKTNRNGGFDGFLNGILVISIWDDRIQFSTPIWGSLESAKSVIECQRMTIEYYQNHKPTEDA